MAKLRAVLLDVFGTLVQIDDTQSPFASLVEGLPRRQMIEALRALVLHDLPTAEDAAEMLRRRFSVSPPSAGLLRSVADAVDRQAAGCSLMPGAEALLGDLRARGLRVALVSNLGTPFVGVLRRLGLGELVDHQALSCELGLRKPDAAIFESALAALDASANEAVMVGNSLRSDVEGARSVGLHAVLFRPPELPALTVADCTVIPSLGDLPGVLEAVGLL